MKRAVAQCAPPRSKKVVRNEAHRFFDDPNAAAELAPHPIRSVQTRFENDLLPRVWVAERSKGKIESLSMRAHDFEATLEENGFGVLYGSFELSKEKLKEQLDQWGLKKLSSGGFNQIWSGRMNTASRRVFPPEVSELVAQDRVVIRAPLARTQSDKGKRLIGEMTNVLHAALHGYGPLVAGLAWVRTLHGASTEEGVQYVRYRLLSFMERGERSVHDCIREVAEKGYVPYKSIFSTPGGTHAYFDALLRCVYAYSVDRFVFLDATLRNFVSFTEESSVPRIAVIDIDSTVFRRLECAALASGTEPSHGWKMLWMHNTLVVSCFLKRSLSEVTSIGGRPGVDAFRTYWWDKIAKAVNATFVDLRHGTARDMWFDSSCRLFLSECFWGAEQSYNDVWIFPNMANPPWSGNDPIAVANATLAYMYFYFVRQPFEEIEDKYVKPALAYYECAHTYGAPPAAIKEAADAHRHARAWYDSYARRTLIAPMLYFHSAVRDSQQENGDSRLLATIMIDYCQTATSDLQARWLPQVPLSEKHSHGDLIMFRQYLLRF